jgi:hypothetical protein
VFPPIKQDRVIYQELARVAGTIASGKIAEALE